MKLSAFASTNHVNLLDEWVVLEEKPNARFAGAIDIGVAEWVVGSYFGLE